MMIAMDRRGFSKLALTGLGLAAMPGLARAAMPKPYAPVLERARAALDRHRDRIALRDRVAIADFSAPSRDLRFHIVDLIDGQVNSYLVAHGKGSDPDHSGWLKRFSNEPDSFATSDGSYQTGEIYDGKHGASMRLLGLEPHNSNAEARAIVIHSADYVGENHIAAWGKLGRSEGCFVVAPHLISQVLGLIGPGRLLYADKL